MVLYFSKPGVAKSKPEGYNSITGY